MSNKYGYNASEWYEWTASHSVKHSSELISNWEEAAIASPLSQLHQVGDDGEEPWNRVVKLLVLSAVASIASVGNIFVISAVLMEDHLKKRGNAFVVNIALADLAVTGVSIPAATVGLLANLNDWRLICQIQWNTLLLVSFVTAPSMAAAAADIKLQIGIGPDRYLGLVTASRLAVITLLIWLSSAVFLLVFLLFDLGPDLCIAETADKSFDWSWHIPLILFSIQVLGPIVLTAVVHLCSVVTVRASKHKSPPYLVLHHDASMLLSNIGVYFLSLVCWTPLIVALVVAVSRSLPIRLFNQLQWLAMAKSCLNPFVYAVCSKHYREAFITLYYYCCCKTSVSFSRRVRADSLRPPSDVRVHIIPGYNVYSAVTQGPHHRPVTTSTNRDPNAKPIARPVKMTKMSKASSKNSKSPKQVYEL